MPSDKTPSRPPAPGTSAARTSWTSRAPAPAAAESSLHHESWRHIETSAAGRIAINGLAFRRFGLTLAAIALFLALLWVLFSIRHRAPLIVGIASTYPAPYSPVAFSLEDRDLLGRLAVSGQIFLPPSVTWSDASATIQTGAADVISQTLARLASQAKPGGPRNDVIFVYLAMTGTLDREGRPCLIPPSVSDPGGDDAPGFLRVDRLLDDLRAAVRPAVGIVLVLDGCRESLNWPMGVGDGGFAPAVEALVEERSIPRTWVLLPARSGQMAHANAANRHTVFARFFTLGIRGAADGAPYGDGDGKVDLGEFASYLTGEVDRWALAQCGVRQAPLLVPAVERGPAADNPQLAWVVSKSPADHLGLAPRSSPTAAATMTTSGAAGGRSDSSDADWWLRERWNKARQLSAIAVHERPYHWESYLSHLLLAEQLRSAGAAYSDEIIRVETLVERFELRLESRYLGIVDPIPSIRLHQIARQQTVAPQDQVSTLRTEDVAKRVMEPPPPGKPLPALPVAASSNEWLDAYAVATDWLRERVDAGVAFDRDMLTRWLDAVPPRPATLTFDSNLINVTRIMTRWLDPGVWQSSPRLPGRIVRLLSLSREAAYPLDIRADRIVRAVAPRAAVDASMREALDLLFVGSPAALERSADLTDACTTAYREMSTVAEETSRSFRFSDVMHHELPWLSAWYVHEKRAAAAGEQDGDGEESFIQTFDWTPLVDSLRRFDATLFERLARLDRAEDRLTPAELLTLLSENRRRVESHYTPLRAAYDSACEDLAALAPDTPATLAGIKRVLVTPLVQGDLRMQLLARAERLTRKFAVAEPSADEQSRQPPQPFAAAAAAGWMPWRESLVHPLLPLLGIDFLGTSTAPTQPPQVAAAIGRQLAEIRAAVTALPGELSRIEELRVKSQVDPQASSDEPVLHLRRSEFLARRLAPINRPPQFFSDVTPTQRSLTAAWHDRLVDVAEISLDDFWAGSEPGEPAWYFDFSRLLLQQAADVTQAAKMNYGDVRRRRVEERMLVLGAQGDAFGRVSFSPPSILLFPAQFRDDTPDNRTRLEPARGVPKGLAAIWLSQSMHSGSLPVLRDAGKTTLPRLPIPVAASGEATEALWRLDPSTDRLMASRGDDPLPASQVLDMVVWFRGHRIVTGLPLETAATIRTTEWRAAEPAAPRVTVRGDMPRNQTVSIVFDCSGSMGERLFDGRTRLESGREALYDLLDFIARDGGWSASLWLYGHRTRWARDSRGRYTAELTEAGRRERDRTVTDGKQFSLLPGNDVEQVMDIQPLSPVQVLRIRSILDAQEPGGETPLYRAINEALRVDCADANPGPAHVVVVTDGANDQSGGTIITSADVLRTLSRVNFKRSRQDQVRVDVIGFNLAAGRFDRELRLQDLQSLAADSGGRFFDATDPGKLAASLRESLRIVRWGVQGGDAPRGLVELDEAVVLPRPVPGRPDTYDVGLEAGTAASRRRVTVSGNEGLQLFVAAGGRGLEFRRYDGGTEQGLRDSIATLPDPLDPARRCFIGAHMAVRNGTTVTFPVSIQNADAGGFSPRPVEAWVEVQPRSPAGAVGLPYVFFDLTWQPLRPVPVLDLHATNWPPQATAAEIRCWFRFRPAAPELAVPVRDLIPGVERRFEVKCLPGSSVRALVSRDDSSPRSLRLTVIEEHPQPTARNLPLLRVAVAPDCLRALHILEPGTGRMRHEFEVAMVDGQLSADVRLLVTDRQAIVKGAVGSLAPQGAGGTLSVPVPRQ